MEKQSLPGPPGFPAAASAGPSERQRVSPLSGDARLFLMTYPAQRLLHGRDAARGDSKAAAIVGLFKFAAMMRVIWVAAGTGNPYAQWWLVRVERERVQTEHALFALEQRVDRIYEQAPPEVELRPARAVTPLKVRLSFSTPYAYLGAYLLGKFDRLVRRVLTARHVGLLDGPGADRLLAGAGRLLRRFYLSAAGFRMPEVSRADLEAGNERAARAREQMGEIPPEILAGKVYAALRPQAERPARLVRPVLAGPGAALATVPAAVSSEPSQVPRAPDPEAGAGA